MRITIVEFGVNDASGNGRPTSCGGIEIRTDITKLPNMITARFRED